MVRVTNRWTSLLKCLVTAVWCSTLFRLPGRAWSSLRVSQLTLSSVSSSELLSDVSCSSPAAWGRDCSTWDQWFVEVVLSCCKCSAVSGSNVKKSIPNLTINSTRRAGLSRFPAYLRALVRARISSAVDSPRPSIIDFEVNAAISPAKFEMPVITVVWLLQSNQVKHTYPTRLRDWIDYLNLERASHLENAITDWWLLENTDNPLVSAGIRLIRFTVPKIDLFDIEFLKKETPSDSQDSNPSNSIIAFWKRPAVSIFKQTSCSIAVIWNSSSLNCGKQNHFNVLEMVEAMSSSESTKRTRQNFFLFSVFSI